MDPYRLAMPDGPLRRYTCVRTADSDEFLSGLNSVYGPSLISASTRPDRRQTHELRAVAGEGFAIGYVNSGLGVRITPGAEPSPYYFNLSVNGVVLLHVGGEELVNDHRTAVVVSPGLPQRLTPTAGNTGTLGIKLESALVEAELAALLGWEPDEPVRFATALDLTTPAGRGLRSLVLTLLREADRPPGGAFDQPAVRLQYVRTLITALLTMHRHNYSQALLRPSPQVGPRALRKALDHIELHLAGPITLGDITRAAGCGARTLNGYFHDHLGLSPMNYVRDLRLQRVHEELRRSGRPVTDVAVEWGFTHLGRFSASYRQKFGVLPSQTARGAWGSAKSPPAGDIRLPIRIAAQDRRAWRAPFPEPFVH